MAKKSKTQRDNEYRTITLPLRVSGALRWIIKILNKEEIRYQISGGLCARFYGSKRYINDIDIDIPEAYFTRLKPLVKRYLISGPEIYRDKKWEILMMSIRYKGQLIELTSADFSKISNYRRTKWIVFRYKLQNSRHILWKDLSLNLMPPEKLLKYKKHLDGKKQKEDIKAIEKYISLR